MTHRVVRFTRFAAGDTPDSESIDEEMWGVFTNETCRKVDIIVLSDQARKTLARWTSADNSWVLLDWVLCSRDEYEPVDPADWPDEVCVVMAERGLRGEL